MADPATLHAPKPHGATGVLVLADGSVAWGRGFGAAGTAVGEVCFNTAMTGYQEVMTDPSYAGQVVTFTFPHIGNVGTNPEDMESHDVPGAVGCVVREDVTDPASFRSTEPLQAWLAARGKIGLAGIDTRALTRRIRMLGAPNAVIAHDPAGNFDIPALIAQAKEWPGLEGMDLARLVTRAERADWQGGVWKLGQGFARSPHETRPHVVAIDYGAKDNIFRNLVRAGAQVPAIKTLCTLYVELIRGVPLITVLFMASFMLPLFMPEGVSVDVLIRVVIAITLFSAAYMAEVVRGGLQALPKGQTEAAATLGLSYWQAQRKIVLPQALSMVVPSLMNTFIGMFKDTSLVTIVSLYELTGALALALNADADWRPFKLEAYFFITLIYFVFCFAMSRYSLWVEKRTAVSKVR